MALIERIKKSTSPSLVTSSSSIKKNLESKHEIYSKGNTKVTSPRSSKNGRRPSEHNSLVGPEGDKESPLFTSASKGFGPKIKHASSSLSGGEEVNERNLEHDVAFTNCQNFDRQPGVLRTTIGTSKFRASPILKNPKTHGESPLRDELDRPESAKPGDDAANAFYYNGTQTNTSGDCADNVSSNDEYGRWEQNSNHRYWESDYGRRPPPRLEKDDEQERLDAETEEENGPNLVSPSKSNPPRFSENVDKTRNKNELERPSPRGRGQSNIAGAPSSSSPTSNVHDRYAAPHCEFVSPSGITAKVAETPYAYESVGHDTPRRNGYMDGSAGLYQYSPVRTRSKDFDSEAERDLPSQLLELAKSPTLTPRRKPPVDGRGDDNVDSPWRPRYGEFSAHSSPQMAWDVGCIATPRPTQAPHYSPPDTLGFGYLTSPREGWGSSPYRSTAPPSSLPRADESESLPKWTDSPDGSLVTSPTKPVRSLFRETPKEKESKPKPKPKPFIEKRSHPVGGPVPHSPWNFVRSLGVAGSFEDQDPSKSPYSTPSRMHSYKTHPGASAPPSLPSDMDSYWGDYYGRYCPPPSRFSSQYGQTRGWSSVGRHLPQSTAHRAVPLPHRPVATPAAPVKSTTGGSGASSRTKINSSNSNINSNSNSTADSVEGPAPVAVTPTNAQALALQQYGEAVEFSKNRLRELLIISNPPKGASCADRNVPPWDIVPADHTLLDEITSNDVLLGRGGGTNTQAGNKRFRAIVNAHQPMYLQARRKEKPLIARCIVEWIRLKEGRFLKKEDKSGKWHEVGDDRAEAKTSQALREGLDVREKKGVSCGGSVGSGSAAATTPSNSGSGKKKRKAKTPDSLHPADRRGYDPRLAGWADYPPAHHPHSYYGRYYEASRRMRGRDDYGHGPMPPHAHHAYYHHPNAYAAHPSYAVPPSDYRTPSKQLKWTESARGDSGDYPPVPAAVSSAEHDREKQYYRDFTPPASSKREKLPVVASSYDQGE